MKNFKIPAKYLVGVNVSKIYEISFVDPKSQQVVTGPVRFSSYEDHPQFTRLRKYLAKHGFIEMVTNYSNGDTVLKPFRFNGYRMRKGKRFMCAPALGIALKCAIRGGWKFIDT